MIRMGIVTRVEALAALEMDFGSEIIGGIVNKLNLPADSV